MTELSLLLQIWCTELFCIHAKKLLYRTFVVLQSELRKMNACNGIREVFTEGNLSKVLELITRGFNMNVRYAAGETIYQEDPVTGR